MGEYETHPVGIRHKEAEVHAYEARLCAMQHELEEPSDLVAKQQEISSRFERQAGASSRACSSVVTGQVSSDQCPNKRDVRIEEDSVVIPTYLAAIHTNVARRI